MHNFTAPQLGERNAVFLLRDDCAELPDCETAASLVLHWQSWYPLTILL